MLDQGHVRHNDLIEAITQNVSELGADSEDNARKAFRCARRWKSNLRLYEAESALRDDQADSAASYVWRSGTRKIFPV